MRILLFLAAALAAFADDPSLTPEMQAAANHISAASLRGHLAFLASDLLEGRATPSRGLDLAAEYIAAQFRRAGLEPVGDDGYFQTATLILREPNWEGFQMTVTAAGKTIRVERNEAFLLPDAALNLDNVPMLAIDSHTAITPELVNGKVVLAADKRAARGLEGMHPTLVLRFMREIPAHPQVRDPEDEHRGFAISVISNPEVAALLAGGKEGRVTIHLAAPLERPVKVHNVAGLLRGSSPDLRDTYVMLTAHYDHLGKGYGGANDDGSGTVSMMEIAGALAATEPRPRRSVLFVAFFGEEIGLIGSRYYSRHPLAPLEKTVADLNLEQLGRTDASNGPQIGTATVTGFDFSDVTRALVDAGRLAGIKVYKDDEGSDAYFARSDNQALADAGIPAHTLCVAFNYPDYHGTGDRWEKIDYENMAKVDRMVAIALLRIASEAPPPAWNESNAAARKYAGAARKLHP